MKSGVALHAEEEQDGAWNYFFFSDVPMYLYVNTLKMYQQFSTYSLIIDGNGIKQSIQIFWKEVMVSLS